MYSLTNFFGFKIIFLPSITVSRRRNRKWLTARAVFLFMVSLSFYGWSFLFMVFPYKVCCKRQHMQQISCHFFSLRCYIQGATIFQLVWDFSVKLLFDRRHLAIYPILLHCETKPYLKNNTELYPILILYRTETNPNTLPN